MEPKENLVERFKRVQAKRKEEMEKRGVDLLPGSFALWIEDNGDLIDNADDRDVNYVELFLAGGAKLAITYIVEVQEATDGDLWLYVCVGLDEYASINARHIVAAVQRRGRLDFDFRA